uniref:DUF3506 domain-containing protein n=1 Tax=Echinostoma caproni TaxID=27848 RepID=A0A183AZW3_9TREM
LERDEVPSPHTISTGTAQLVRDSPVDWSASCLPPVRFDLTPIPELNPVRNAALICPHRTEAVQDTPKDANAASGSTPAVPDVVLVPEDLPEPLEMAFLGAVELPHAFESMDPIKLNDLFSYVLSCRSASASPEPLTQTILLTKTDLWLLSRNHSIDAETVEEAHQTTGPDPMYGDVLVRIPFHQLTSWLIYPENPRYVRCWRFDACSVKSVR